MILRLLEEDKPLDEVLFFDTGMEFDSIYRNRDKIKEVLSVRNIRFTELHSKNSFLFDMFVRPVTSAAAVSMATSVFAHFVS